MGVLALERIKHSSPWLVTGASAGIGQAVVESLLQDDAVSTVIAAVRTPETLRSQLKIKDFPTDKLQIVKFDLLDDSSIESALAWVDEKYGKIDTFFGCAGVGGDLAEIEGLPKDVIDRNFQVNFFGSFRAIQTAVEKWRYKGGFRIIQVSTPGACLTFVAAVNGVRLPVRSASTRSLVRAGMEPRKLVCGYLDSRSIPDNEFSALENLLGTYSQELSPDWKIKVMKPLKVLLACC